MWRWRFIETTPYRRPMIIKCHQRHEEHNTQRPNGNEALEFTVGCANGSRQGCGICNPVFVALIFSGVVIDNEIVELVYALDDFINLSEKFILNAPIFFLNLFVLCPCHLKIPRRSAAPICIKRTQYVPLLVHLLDKGAETVLNLLQDIPRYLPRNVLPDSHLIPRVT